MAQIRRKKGKKNKSETNLFRSYKKEKKKTKQIYFAQIKKKKGKTNFKPDFFSSNKKEKRKKKYFKPETNIFPSNKHLKKEKNKL